jgi:hypothetical protein
MEREGIEIFNIPNEMVDAVILQAHRDYFNQRKASIDKEQGNIIKAYSSDMTHHDIEEASNTIVSVMPTWLYLEIENGTKDKHFWEDDSNRKKFYKDNPQYLLKNFK